ncbi:MAG: flippase-like domain-containing protein [Gemmatimonadetes bacterium]|nr:flippase-like domain-containing protein [Gemmatimonadota bacterium]
MKLDWKALLGLGITAFLLWYIFREVDFAEVWTHVRQAHVGLLLAAVAVATAGFLIRSWRWKVLLAPVRPNTSLRNRYAAVNIGFMANNLLPARVGEFARAYALSKLEPVPLSAALGTLVVERVLDALVMIGILVVTMTSPSFPSSAVITAGPLGKALNAIVVLVIVLVLMLTVLVVLPRQVVRFAEKVSAALPGGRTRSVVGALESFLGSLSVLRSPRLLFAAVLWSIAFWLWHGLSFWLAMLAFDIHAGPVAAYFTEAVVGFGVAIPAAPGFFGTFHASASWALSVFGVPDASSLAFAFGYHMGGFIPVTLIGLYYAGRMGLSLKEVGAGGGRGKEASSATGP